MASRPPRSERNRRSFDTGFLWVRSGLAEELDIGYRAVDAASPTSLHPNSDNMSRIPPEPVVTSGAAG